MNKDIIKKLQNEAENFLNHLQLSINGCIIEPKEIEVYYYEKTVFEDTSVHRNDLQRINLHHFYVHPAGLDFVVSDSENYYHSYLIRSAVVNENMIIGPINVREKIFQIINCSYKEKDKIKDMMVELSHNVIKFDVLFSERIGLGKNAGEYINCELRAVLCDEYFRKSKYKNKERLIINFLQNNDWCLENKKEYAKKHLGYIPSAIKNLCSPTPSPTPFTSQACCLRNVRI